MESPEVHVTVQRQDHFGLEVFFGLHVRPRRYLGENLQETLSEKRRGLSCNGRRQGSTIDPSFVEFQTPSNDSAGS